MSEEIEYADRYSALGIPRPDEKSCKGPCEATGSVPTKHRDFGNVLIRTDGQMNDLARELVEDINERRASGPALDPEYAEAWWKAHREAHTRWNIPKQMITGWKWRVAGRRILRRPWNTHKHVREIFKYWWWLWFSKERLQCDGWHFLTCTTCKGTRIQPT